MTTPIENIVPRILDAGVAKVLSQFSMGIEELVNYGSKIILWDLEDPKGNDEHLPATLLLRNFLEQIDAISILIKSSSIDPCKNLLRTALENYFYINYLFEKDTYNRSMSFLICNSMRNREWALKADGKSESYKLLREKYKKDKLLKHSTPVILQNVEKYVLNSDALINSTKYNPFYLEFKRTKKVLKHTPSWYSLFDGPKNLQELADKLNYSGIYEMLYRSWSSTSHGVDVIQGKIASTHPGYASIYQIRLPKDAQSITQHSINLSIILFKQFIEKRVQSHSNDYKKWYLEYRKFSNKLSEKQLIILK